MVTDSHVEQTLNLRNLGLVALMACLCALPSCLKADDSGSPGPGPWDTGYIHSDTGNAQPDMSGPVKDTFQPQDTFQCPTVQGIKPIGAECQYNCECGTDYCYNEGFNGELRFCTRACEGGCEDTANSDGTQKHQCLIFSGIHKETYGLTLMNICANRCNNVDECKMLSSSYDACGTSSGWTEWMGKTVGVATCIVSSAFEE
jgi:hypothetical protein